MGVFTLTSHAPSGDEKGHALMKIIPHQKALTLRR
jgi:hypothetical protein